jgi:hypothetical protein
MRVAKIESAKIYGTVNQKQREQLIEWANSLGMTMNQFVGLCTWMGAKSLMRTIEPEKMLTPDQWVALGKAAKDAGLASPE